MTSHAVTAFLRRSSPAVLDTRVYSCFSVLPKTCPVGALSTSATVHQDDSPNRDFQVNPLFENRNPRNLEQMGLARKRQGWVFQSPRKDFFHRVVLDLSRRHTTAHIEHFSGKTVVSASTTEWAIKEGLYSLTDTSAAENVGRVLAQRCLESGITHVFYEEEEGHQTSEKMQAFLSGLRERGLGLEEPDIKDPEFVAGVDYSRPHRVGEKKSWKDDYQPL
ncbi:large ribosomal subunit protein uL18m-like [Babylonia areolata]|uniref:large ribosomal subunit protein uL18m-like n=1 Tax=Babylonia areolata TaxID=304850 RepID=UPI003FD6A1B0